MTIWLVFIIVALSCDNEKTIYPFYKDYFIKYYGESGNQWGVDMKQLPDGFILLGASEKEGEKKKIYLVKVDELGNEVWSATFGNEFGNEAASIKITPEGNFIIAATVGSASGQTDVMLLRVDQNGNKLDSAVYGSPLFSETASEVINAASGEYVLIGTSEEVQLKELNGIWVLRTQPGTLDTLSQQLWRRYHANGDLNYGVGVVQAGNYFYCLATSDGEDVNQGSSRSGTNYYLIPLEGSGEQLTYKAYGTPGEEIAAQLLKTDGGFVLLGTTVSGSQSEIYVTKISEGLAEQGQFNVFGQGNIKASAIADYDLGYLILGEEWIGDDGNIFLANVDKFGNPIWKRSYGSTFYGETLGSDYGGKSVVKLKDGSIVFIATVAMEFQMKMALFKVNQEGDLKPEG